MHIVFYQYWSYVEPIYRSYIWSLVTLSNKIN